MRVNVQLIEAATGAHLWAERFDKPLADLFDMQDEIVARLASELNTELYSAEARRSEPAGSSSGLLDLQFLGTAWLRRGPTSENLSKARNYFERALAIDPVNVVVLVEMAWVDLLTAVHLLPDDRAARLAASEAASAKALSLVPDYPWAHFSLGSVLGNTGRVEQGITECDRALAIDRNIATAHATIGFFKASIGRPEETEAHVNEALRLSPRDAAAFYWLLIVGIAEIFRDRHGEAAAWLRRSIEANRNNPMSYFLLAAVLAILGGSPRRDPRSRPGSR